MATIDDVQIVPTPKGVKIPISAIYVYPNGHANLVFPGDVNVPCDQEYHVVAELAKLLRRAQAMALKKRPRSLSDDEIDDLLAGAPARSERDRIRKLAAQERVASRPDSTS